MYRYSINSALAPFEGPPAAGDSIVVLMTSAELAQGVSVPGFEDVLRHTPSARDARVCKAEARHGFLCGTIVTPRCTKNHLPISL